MLRDHFHKKNIYVKILISSSGSQILITFLLYALKLNNWENQNKSLCKFQGVIYN